MKKLNVEMKFHYDVEDDVLSIYTDVAPSETVEVSEFVNVDINKEKGIVGLEIFEASEFFSINDIGKSFLGSLRSLSLEYAELRGTLFVKVNFVGADGIVVSCQLPSFRKSEYECPLLYGK